MPLLFVMSLSGSIAALIYMILEPLMKRYFPVSWKRKYLICNILCFIVPYQYVIGMNYKKLIHNLYAKCLVRNKTEYISSIDVTSDVIQIFPKGIYMEDAFTYIVLTGSVLVSLLLLYRQYNRYKVIRRYLAHNKQDVERSERVRVIRCEEMTSPFTIGIIHPIIVLPDMAWEQKELEYVMEHERIHIRQKDNMIKLLALIMLILHFYNPLAYYILHKWNIVAELSCDARVLSGKSMDEIKAYGLLVIRLSEEKKEKGLLPVIGFNIQNRDIQERISNMKRKQKKMNVWKTICGTGIMSMAMLVSSLSVCAYNPKEVQHVNSSKEQITLSADVAFQDDEYLFETCNADWVFMDENGNVIAQSGEEEKAGTYALCWHNYVKCQAKMHSRNSSGGCTTEIYDAIRCDVCGSFEIGDLVSTHTYATCPH